MALTPSNNKSREEKMAERQAAQDDVLMREIDDAVRQDEYARLAKTYGRPLLVLLVVGLIAFAGYLFWDSQREGKMEEQSEALVGALDQLDAGNLDSAAQQAAALAANSEGGAWASARLIEAGVAMEQGKNADAVKIFAEVAGNEDAPAALRDLARIREVAANYDNMKPDDVIAKLKPMAVPGNAYFGSAGELVAMAYLEKGDRKQAGTLFGEIAKSDDVPETLQSRARQMAGLLGIDAVEDVDELLEQQGAGTGIPAGQGSE
ncbi:hypothetical protein AMC99_00597 [Altererythrobacter epoxidivorans]|uniref:Ancillary SecYEG translocon subunit/Cell division coordinator CpoB TPR domain-containing protein n=2 Tax=Altererythrobacter epoxidivorans TaxID=361183 RepID=A0A0M5KY77_9SPHN|nr:hypothetical protein AMC99_00597 [Altererythrobacter epoxidivorans]